MYAVALVRSAALAEGKFVGCDPFAPFVSACITCARQQVSSSTPTSTLPALLHEVIVYYTYKQRRSLRHWVVSVSCKCCCVSESHLHVCECQLSALSYFSRYACYLQCSFLLLASAHPLITHNSLFSSTRNVFSQTSRRRAYTYFHISSLGLALLFVDGTSSLLMLHRQ